MRKDNTEQIKQLLLKQEKAISELQEKIQVISSNSEKRSKLMQFNSYLLLAIFEEIVAFQIKVIRCRFRK